jgi:predicted AlkP superfamily phosphohydrolase/phosphomutase
MSKAKVRILGIDGMDFQYMQSIIDELPHIKRLSETNTVLPFRSVFPPDSIPSWITCYTGKDPSEHGILESVDYFAKGDARLKVDTSVFHGKTFWDIIGNAGHSVTVINPFMAYPVWPVNGVMVNGPVFINGNIQTSDPRKIEGITVPQNLGGITQFPTKKTMDAFVRQIFLDTKEQADFGLSLLERNNPDLFFQVFLTMDRIQHFLWRFCDENDPTYPGRNPHSNAIRDFYIIIDQIIGRYLHACDPMDRVLIISDHGHGMRCTQCFNMNEYLRKRGDLKSAAEGKWLSLPLFIEIAKNHVLSFMHKNDLQDYISVVAKWVPKAKQLKKGKHVTKSNVSSAYTSDFTGVNPFGGICINRDLVSDYEHYRDELIRDLLNIRHRGTLIFEWIQKREVVYKGKYLQRFPDILFCLRPEYGLSWNLYTKLFTENPTHKRISGGHREYGVFMSNITPNFINGDEVRMSNFFASLLDSFGIKPPKDNSGNSFFSIR